MLSKGLRVLLVLAAALPAVAQVSSPPVATPKTTGIIAPRQHAPRRVAGLHPDRVVDNVTVSDSTNWGGYAVTGSSFTNARGSWTVPTVDCAETPNTYVGFWVGIDGFSSDTVEQIGTDADCDDKSPSYYAWYDFYPNPSVVISSVTVSPGDKMSGEVNYSGSEFTVTITNETTGKSYSTDSKVAGAARSSAEWITEAPCCTNSGGIQPLADFAVVYFGEDYTDVSDTNYATDSTTSGPIGAFLSNDIFEINLISSSGAEEAITSPLTKDGTSFSVTWKSE
jgi:hypothetical protein